MNLDFAIKFLREDLSGLPCEYVTATTLVCDAAERAMHKYRLNSAQGNALVWRNPFDFRNSAETGREPKANPARVQGLPAGNKFNKGAIT